MKQMTAKAQLMNTALSRNLWRCVCAMILFPVAAASLAGLTAFAVSSPIQFLSPITNSAQWLELTNGETSRGYPLRVEGVVTLAETNRNLLVVQDAAGALAVNLDLQTLLLRPGQRILLEGENASPYVATYPDYPNRPSTSEWRSSFEARSGLGFDYAARMRGYLHPPTTGEYTFWIASDNSSDLWLSRNSDPAGARRIACIGTGLSARPREWSRLSSQRSEPILLEAGKAYYIEAVHEQGSGPDNLAVAWEGPSVEQSVIDGRFLSPWGPDVNRRLATGTTGQTNGLVWEYFTNYPARSVRPLTAARTSAALLTLRNPRVTKLGQAALPEAQPLDLAQPLAAKDDFRWVEVQGTVDFVAKAGGLLALDLVENRTRLTILVQNWPEDRIPQWEGLRVKVRGVCEQTIGANGEPAAAIVHSPSAMNVSVVGPGAELWSSLAATPICNLDPSDPSLAWGRRIMVRGKVARQQPGMLWIQSAANFYGSVSSNGVEWVPAGPTIEIVMSNSVLAGLSVASFTTNTLGTATFDHVAGWAAPAQLARINNATPNGGVSFRDSTVTLKGGGRGIRNKWDQLAYLYDALPGEGEIVVRLNTLEGDDPRAMAGIMFRSSLSPHAPFVNLGVNLRDGALLQYRQESDLNSVTLNLSGYQAPCWLKLALRHSCLPAQVENPPPLHPGQSVDLEGFLAWKDGSPVLREARCRMADAEQDALAPASVPAAFFRGHGESGGTDIGQIISQIGGWREESDALQVRGVVTFAGQISGKDYTAIQDETAGIFIELPRGSLMLPALRVGQIVQFEGRRNGKSFEPNSMAIMGMGQMPKPVVHPEEYEMMQQGHGDWIQIDGIVQSIAHNGAMQVMTKAGFVTARVGQASTDALMDYVNALVRMRGVASWSGDNELQLLVPSQTFIEVREQPPEDPFVIPSIPIARVTRFNNNYEEVHRLKVEGVVTFRHAGLVFVQDASGAAALQTADAAAMNEGDLIKAVGFPQRGANSPILTEALLQKQRPGSMPSPIPCSMAEILQGKRDGAFVRLKAMVLGQQHLSSGDAILNLEAENRAFRATLTKDRGHLTAIPVGSVVEAAGICYAERVESPRSKLALEDEPMIAAFNLLLRNPGDVVLLQRPPWWNWKHTVAVVGCLLLVLAGSLGWIHLLRHRVAERTRELEIAMAKLKQETQVSATLAERQRLAGEIHDGLEQGLSGIMMQLNGVTSALEAKPDEARGFLELARNMVRFSHAELRHSLLNLQSPLLANADLGTALAEIARQMKSGLNCTEIITHATGTVRALPPAVENHLFRIGQEAINNALKHAHAKTIEIHVCYSAESVRLSVRDDGAGFDQTAVLAGTVGQHLGLRSLRDRARKMGGQLTVVSEPQRGAAIEVVVPLTKQPLDPPPRTAHLYDA